jgi:molybdate transport system substrate-binding protein
MPFAVLLLLLFLSPTAMSDTLRIAVASNFKPTLEQINLHFEAQSGHKLLLSSASTGALTSQITYGAPFDLFLAADQAAPQRILEQDADKKDPTFCYAIGRLVLAGAEGNLSRLADPELSLAIANPVTAPYGRAAQQVLSRKQFAPGNTRKLVRGNNAVQAHQFWYSGAVDLALIPKAHAPQDAVEIPSEWHDPLEQHAVVLRTSPAMDTYLEWFRSDTVRSLIIQAGYEPCP